MLISAWPGVGPWPWEKPTWHDGGSPALGHRPPTALPSQEVLCAQCPERHSGASCRRTAKCRPSRGLGQDGKRVQGGRWGWSGWEAGSRVGGWEPAHQQGGRGRGTEDRDSRAGSGAGLRSGWAAGRALLGGWGEGSTGSAGEGAGSAGRPPAPQRVLLPGTDVFCGPSARGRPGSGAGGPGTQPSAPGPAGEQRVLVPTQRPAGARPGCSGRGCTHRPTAAANAEPAPRLLLQHLGPRCPQLAPVQGAGGGVGTGAAGGGLTLPAGPHRKAGRSPASVSLQRPLATGYSSAHIPPSHRKPNLPWDLVPSSPTRSSRSIHPAEPAPGGVRGGRRLRAPPGGRGVSLRWGRGGARHPEQMAWRGFVPCAGRFS